jgi:hypothetical protein
VKDKKEDFARACTQMSLANYVFGQFEDAVRSAEEALAYCETNGVEPSITNIVKMDLSYLIAEARFHHKKKYGSEWAERAKRLIAEVIGSIPPEDEKVDCMDTLGAVEIMCGENEDEVRNGYEICKEANKQLSQDHPLKEVADAYFRLHERRAFRRLLEWE